MSKAIGIASRADVEQVLQTNCRHEGVKAVVEGTVFQWIKCFVITDVQEGEICMVVNDANDHDYHNRVAVLLKGMPLMAYRCACFMLKT